MAFSRAFIASPFLSFLLLHLTHANQMMDINGTDPIPQDPTPIGCGEACNVRCQKSSRPNLCMRACGSCFAKCSCLPPGTSGNNEACPCYSGFTTRKGIRKCP